MDEEQKVAIFKVLGVLAAGVVVASAVVAPGILIALTPFVAKKTRSDKRDAYRALRYAQRQKWVQIGETDEGIRAAITPKGRRRWQQLRFDQPLTGSRWDGKWRLVIFDIPNKRKGARDALRATLKRIGLYQLQESVWITPWPCDDHIAALRAFYVIPRYVQVVEATRLEREGDLLAKFNLTR